MAITITATKGNASANSYAAAGDADTYLNTIYGGSEWAGLSADDKARLLITATKYLERLPVKYDKAAATQALKFPVLNTSLDAATEGDGFTEAKEACILQALYLLTNSDAIQEALNSGIQGTQSESLSSVSKSISGFNQMRKWHPDVLKLLSKFFDFSLKSNRY